MSSPVGGDLAAELVDRHGSAIRRYVCKATSQPSLADDLTQEIFLHIVRAAATYDPRERERAWVLRIARNVVIDAQRRSARSREAFAPVDVVVAPAQPLVTALQAALGKLSADEREAFLLGEVGGLTYAEIAGATANSVAAIRSRIYRARLALRASLSPPPPVGPSTLRVRDDDD
jgi:RNA polymerase sigma-70 factor, ECF subfamily